jgi:hypothetical protein
MQVNHRLLHGPTGKLEQASTSAWAPPGFSPNDYFYGHWHSKSPGNRLKINDPKLDEWAEAQRFELDEQKRREIFKKMWDHELDLWYRPPLESQYGFSILQSWLRGVRFGGQFGTNSEFYDWGDQLAAAWNGSAASSRKCADSPRDNQATLR